MFLEPDFRSELNIDDANYFLPVVEAVNYNNRPEIRGLLLQDTGVGRREFRRIGVFNTYGVPGADRLRRPTYDPMLPLEPKQTITSVYIAKAKLGCWGSKHGDSYDSFNSNSNDLMPEFEEGWSEQTITII